MYWSENTTLFIVPLLISTPLQKTKKISTKIKLKQANLPEKLIVSNFAGLDLLLIWHDISLSFLVGSFVLIMVFIDRMAVIYRTTVDLSRYINQVLPNLNIFLTIIWRIFHSLPNFRYNFLNILIFARNEL